MTRPPFGPVSERDLRIVSRAARPARARRRRHRRALRVRRADGRRDGAAPARRHAVPDVLLPLAPRRDRRDVVPRGSAAHGRVHRAAGRRRRGAPRPTAAPTATTSPTASRSPSSRDRGHLGRRHAHPREVPARARGALARRRPRREPDRRHRARALDLVARPSAVPRLRRRRGARRRGARKRSIRTDHRRRRRRTRRPDAQRVRGVPGAPAVRCGSSCAPPRRSRRRRCSHSAEPAPAHADLVRDYEYWLADYGFTTAWNTTQGEGVTVAVIDTGVNGNVAELRGAVVGGTDVSGLGTPDGQTPVGDDDTTTARWSPVSLAGRGTGEGSGVIGVAPEADLLVGLGRVRPGHRGRRSPNDDQIAEAVRWAVDNGADVINMSLTRNTPDWPESWDDAFMYAFDHDVVVVAAAGNRGSGTSEVGAPGDDPRRAHRRRRRQGQEREPRRELAGHHDRRGRAERGPRRRAARRAATCSGAARAARRPIVSGLVALDPRRSTPTSTPRTSSTGSSHGRPATGRRSRARSTGTASSIPVAALDADVPTVDANPLGSLAEWITLHRRARGRDTRRAHGAEQPIVPIADPPLPRSDGAPDPAADRSGRSPTSRCRSRWSPGLVR